MSKKDYTKTGKVEFFEADDCKQPINLASLTGGPMRLNGNSYVCKEAYYRISSPMGTEICRVTNLHYSGARRWKGKIVPGNAGFRIDRCRFKD